MYIYTRNIGKHLTETLCVFFKGTVSGRHESWEFDSGARDLSPEPHTLQKLVEAAAGGTGNMLELANKVGIKLLIHISINYKLA